MFSVILFQPEIPPNTGNIIRLCANTGCSLHLIEPIGFTFEDKQLRRAGLDYHDLASIQIHHNLATCLEKISPPKLYALTAKGKTLYTEPTFSAGDAFLFGPETRGLPAEIIAEFPPELRLCLPQHTVDRSLNLSNTVAVMIYEAWRQLAFIK